MRSQVLTSFLGIFVTIRLMSRFCLIEILYVIVNTNKFVESFEK